MKGAVDLVPVADVQASVYRSAGPDTPLEPKPPTPAWENFRLYGSHTRLV
jgi:hypothetical protein